MRRAPRDRLGGAAIQLAAALDLVSAHAVENADRRARIVDPQQVTEAGKQAGAELARKAGDPKQRHHLLRLAREQLVERDSPVMPARRAEDLGEEADLAFLRAGEEELVGKAAALIERCHDRAGQRLDAARRIMPVDEAVGATRQARCRPRRDRERRQGPAAAPRRC